MSAITPHYRSVQQLLQSQSFSIDEYQCEYKWENKAFDNFTKDEQLDRRKLVTALVELVWAPQRLQEAAV